MRTIMEINKVAKRGRFVVTLVIILGFAVLVPGTRAEHSTAVNTGAADIAAGTAEVLGTAAGAGTAGMVVGTALAFLSDSRSSFRHFMRPLRFIIRRL